MAEYEVPPREVPENDAGYLEKITQAVFQAGFSWQVIRSKWPNFQKAFADFLQVVPENSMNNQSGRER